jgi:hypothetical protein
MSKFFDDTMQGLLEAVAMKSEESLSQALADDTGRVVDLERFVTDGRLTEPSDGKRFEWRKMIDEVKKLGRPLTEDEAEKFKVKL